MTSHSDPGIAQTLRVFDRLEDAVARSAWTATDIERAVIACAREEETPIRPGLATDTALWRHLSGITQELRRTWREALLAATPQAVREAMLAMIGEARGWEGTAVLSSRRRLRQAAAALSAPLAIRPLAGDARRRPDAEVSVPRG